MPKKILPLTSILFLVFLATSIFKSFAQQESRDVVYLKNGSIIKGQILEMIPDENIKIETADGSIFVFKMADVEKTSIEIVEKKSSRSISKYEEEPAEEGTQFKTKGWFSIMKIGPFGNLITSGLDVGIGGIVGYQVNEFASLGLGAELNSYSWNYSSERNSMIVPIYIDARLYIPRRRVHPMLHIQIGAITGERTMKGQTNSFASYDFIPNPARGGLFTGVGAGIKVFASQRIAFITSGGFAFHSVKGWHQISTYDPVTNAYHYDYENARKTISFFKMDLGFVLHFSKQ